MRWSGQQISEEQPNTLPGLGKAEQPGAHRADARIRRRHLPRGAGQVRAEQGPRQEPMPFGWTINPCADACTAASTASPGHPHLPGLRRRPRLRHQIVVKVNSAGAPPEMASDWGGSRSPGHQHRPVSARRGPVPADAGHHRALADSGTPFSILTKGTVLAGPAAMAGASQHVPVGLPSRIAALDGSRRRPWSRARRSRRRGWEATAVREHGLTCARSHADPAVPHDILGASGSRGRGAPEVAWASSVP